YESPAGPVLLALLGASVIVVLGATAISTGLAAADGRSDLATLAAVGASPRTRRWLAMSQAAVVAFLGALLGAVAGFVPAAAIVSTLVEWPLIVPWLVLGVVLIGVPVIAALFAGLFTRSRLPMIRRIA
nr:ABC transporter permease [Geodermatophilaceae bacterium]